VSPDFRSDKSESAEGQGIARRAREDYIKRVKPTPSSRRRTNLAATETADMLGFWLAWHLYGGFEGLEDIGMHRSTIFRKIKRFRTYFKTHPDEYTLRGVTLDPEEFWNAYGLNRRR
jgi:hypothetical protein